MIRNLICIFIIGYSLHGEKYLQFQNKLNINLPYIENTLSDKSLYPDTLRASYALGNIKQFLSKKSPSNQEALNAFNAIEDMAQRTPAPRWRTQVSPYYGTYLYENKELYPIIIRAISSDDIEFAIYCYENILKHSRNDFLRDFHQEIGENLQKLLFTITGYDFDNNFNLKLSHFKNVKDLTDFKLYLLSSNQYADKFSDVETSLIEKFTEANNYNNKSRAGKSLADLNSTKSFHALIEGMNSDLKRYHSLNDKTYYTTIRLELFRSLIKSGIEFPHRTAYKFITDGVNRGCTKEIQDTIFNDFADWINQNYSDITIKKNEREYCAFINDRDFRNNVPGR